MNPNALAAYGAVDPRNEKWMRPDVSGVDPDAVAQEEEEDGGFERGSARCKQRHPFTDRGSLSGSAAPGDPEGGPDKSVFGSSLSLFGIGVSGVSDNWRGVGKVDSPPGVDAKIIFSPIPKTSHGESFGFNED